MKMEQVLGVTSSSTERYVIDHAHLQNHRPKENSIQTASELFGVCIFTVCNFYQLFTVVFLKTVGRLVAVVGVNDN